jgi:hypothetical protein
VPAVGEEGDIASQYGLDTLVYEYTRTGRLIIVLIEREEDYTADNNRIESNSGAMIQQWIKTTKTTRV